MKRKTRRAAMALASILLLLGAGLLIYSYVAGPPPKQTLSFSIDWPIPTGMVNALAYNGSMHIDLFLISNGSITQGQKVIAVAAGGMTSSFAKNVSYVYFTFQGSLPCVTQLCSEEGTIYTVGQVTQLILNPDESTIGLPGVTEIGPVNFTTSLGMGPSWLNGDPIFWQSPGTYYISMLIHYRNNTESSPYTLETEPVYVTPASQGLSPIDIVILVVFTIGGGTLGYLTGFVYLREKWKDYREGKRKQAKSDASFRENVNRQKEEKRK